MNALHFLDYLAILLYLSVVGFVGFWVGRRQKTTTEYFVANRSLPGWAVAFSIVGTVISSVSFVAFPGAAFAENFRLLVPNLMVPIILVFVALIIVPFYRHVVGMTSYEYLERRFGLGARMYGSFGFVALRVFDLGFTLLLTAVALEVITGWDIQLVIVGIASFTILYTLFGGIEAVVWNDVVQGLVMAGGALVILATLLFRPEGGPSAVFATAYQAGKFSLGDYSLTWKSLFEDRPTVWLFALSGLSSFGRMYIVEQNIVQRYLVARTDRDAQRAVFSGASFCVVIWITFMVIGACLWAFYQMTGATLPAAIQQKPDNILPYFVATQLPSGLVGLILAGILAAAMQAFSADLTSVATVATQDYFGRFRPQSTDRTRLLFGRCSVLMGGGLAALVALQLTSGRNRAIYELVPTLMSILAGGMLGLFALGFMSKRATGRGAYWGIGVCALFVFWATVTGPLKVDLGLNFPLNPLLIGILSHVILFAAGYLASCGLGGNRPELAGLTIWNLRSGQPRRAKEAIPSW
jgi:solute:Na+ symporter, SSS family